MSEPTGPDGSKALCTCCQQIVVWDSREECYVTEAQGYDSCPDENDVYWSHSTVPLTE